MNTVFTTQCTEEQTSGRDHCAKGVNVTRQEAARLATPWLRAKGLQTRIQHQGNRW